MEEALQLAKEADLVVMTNYYARIEKRGNNQHLVKALKKAGHTVVVVTNFPYRERHDHGSRRRGLQFLGLARFDPGCRGSSVRGDQAVPDDEDADRPEPEGNRASRAESPCRREKGAGRRRRREEALEAARDFAYGGKC